MGAAGRREAEGSSKHCVTSGEHMIRRLMRTSHDESARAAADVRGPALSASRRGETAQRLRRGDVSPEQLHVFENGRL